MIKASQEFIDFLASPLESRVPTFVNNCLTERGCKVADKLGPLLLETLTQNYPLSPATEVAEKSTGDCFHSSVAVFCQFLQMYPHPKFYLVSGTFRRPESKEVIYHSWLQFEDVVFNVSMMPLRPLYSIELVHYKKHNSLTKVIQRLGVNEFNELHKRLASKGLKDGDTVNGEELVNILLAKTLREQERYLNGLKR